MNEIKKDKLQDSLLDNFHIIVDLPQSNKETEKLIKSLSQDSGFPKKKIPPIQFEKSLEGPIDATLLKDHIINQVGTVEITQSNIEDIIKLGALKNGFFNVKDSLIHEMSDLILEDLGIKKERKKVDIRKKLTKYFKHVFFAIVWKKSVNQIQKQKELNLDSEIQHNEHVNQNPSNIKRYTTESKIVKQIPFTNKIDPSNFYLILYSSLITFASIGVFIYGYYKPSFKHYFAKNDKDEKVDLETAFDLLGTGIGFASGGRMAVIFMIDVVLFFMMRDLLTWLGKIPFVGKFFNIFLNEHISLHKICGYLFVIYSFIHTVGHLGGSFVKLADILEPANQWVLVGKLDGIKDYNSLVFRTIPGITGIILVVILSLMFLTAFEFVRRRNFELFSYIHSLYFIFIIVLYIHGCGYWLNNDQVYELAYVTPFLILSFLHVVKKHIQKYSHSPIIDVSFSAQNSVAYIKILKPKYFNITPGEYLFLAVPTISYYQWHPFSIASVGEDGTIKLMIKDSGDFTKSLLALLYKAKCDFISQNKLDILSGKSFHKLSFDFLLKEDQIYNYVCDINDARKNTKLPIYPFVGLYGPVRAPAVGALEKENVIFVGLGVGVSPYLVFLDEYVNFLRKKKKVQTSKKNKSRLMKQFISNFRSNEEFQLSEIRFTEFRSKYGKEKTFFDKFKKMAFYYIARDCDQLSWIEYYIRKMVKYNYDSYKLDCKLFLTTPQKPDSFDSFLFWRGFRKYQKIKSFFNGKIDLLTNLPVEIIYKRPDFYKYFVDNGMEENTDEFNIYVCGNPMLVNDLKNMCSKINKKSEGKLILFPEIF